MTRNILDGREGRNSETSHNSLRCLPEGCWPSEVSRYHSTKKANHLDDIHAADSQLQLMPVARTFLLHPPTRVAADVRQQRGFNHSWNGIPRTAPTCRCCPLQFCVSHHSDRPLLSLASHGRESRSGCVSGPPSPCAGYKARSLRVIAAAIELGTRTENEERMVSR